MIIMEDNQLFVLGALDDLRRTFIQFGLDLVDDWYHKRGQETEDKDIDLVLDLFNKVRKNGDLVNSFSNLLHDFVMPLDDGVDFLGNLLHLARESLRLTWRNMRLGHLCSYGIGLQLICFSSLVAAAK